MPHASNTFIFREEQVEEIPLDVLVQPSRNACNRGVLVIYGGATKKEFRHHVRPLAQCLAARGLNVFWFDFRGNLPANTFEDFGIWHRIKDAEQVFAHIHTHPEYSHMELSVVGVSMGGHIAVEAVANASRQPENLILVAPAAYPPEAVHPSVTFGPQTQAALRIEDAWKRSSVFLKASTISARALVIGFENDSIVPAEAVVRYHAVLGEGLGQRPEKEWRRFDGLKHDGTFDDPAKRLLVADKVAEFITRDHNTPPPLPVP